MFETTVEKKRTFAKNINITMTNSIIVTFLSALIGGLIGTYAGARFLNTREENKMKKVREIAIKALNIIKKYSRQSFKASENEFNTALTITEKRTIIVALHKLGIPFETPYNEVFEIKKIHFDDKVIDKDDIDDIVLQINKGYCDKLFYLDPDSYFVPNALLARRNVAKRYIKEVLSKSQCDKNKRVTYPENWNSSFGIGEYLVVRVLHEQVCFDFLYDNKGNPIPDRIDQIIHEIDMGLLDNTLQISYEVFKSVKTQTETNNIIQALVAQQQNATQNSPNGKAN